LLLQGFDPPTVQAIASRYNNCAIPTRNLTPIPTFSRGYHVEECVLLLSVDRSLCTMPLAILS
jgi:hypothetical protein